MEVRVNAPLAGCSSLNSNTCSHLLYREWQTYSIGRDVRECDAQWIGWPFVEDTFNRVISKEALFHAILHVLMLACSRTDEKRTRKKANKAEK